MSLLCIKYIQILYYCTVPPPPINISPMPTARLKAAEAFLRSFGPSVLRSFGPSVLRSFGPSVLRSFGGGSKSRRTTRDCFIERLIIYKLYTYLKYELNKYKYNYARMRKRGEASIRSFGPSVLRSFGAAGGGRGYLTLSLKQ
jgi:hypothetical protein